MVKATSLLVLVSRFSIVVSLAKVRQNRRFPELSLQRLSPSIPFPKRPIHFFLKLSHTHRPLSPLQNQAHRATGV
jgi:hypothetical protein